MFHLIRKYSNRKLYDTLQKRFIRMEELAELIIHKEEVRVEDSDSNVDITPLAVSKALIKYMQAGHELPDFLKKHVKKSVKVVKRKNVSEPESESFSDSHSYLPAEIRLLDKSLDYLESVTEILKQEPPYNQKLHDELLQFYKDFEKRLRGLKKKHRIP